MPHLRARTVLMGLAATLLAACSTDRPAGPQTDPNHSQTQSLPLAPDPGKVRVCHNPVAGGNLLDIGAAAAAGHFSHGDYIAVLLVNPGAFQTADGAHFRTITDALAAARASRSAAGETQDGACRITIVVSADIYPGTFAGAEGADDYPYTGVALEHFPLIVDMPDITLHGRFEMALDESGMATGEGKGSQKTRLVPIEPLPFANGVSTPILIANRHPDGSAGNGLIVEGFQFESGNDPAGSGGGQGILSLRVTGLTIRGNRFEGGFTESIDLRASTAEVLANHMQGTAGTCDLCLAGPGAFTARGNRLLAGGIPGIAVSPAVGLPVPPEIEPYALPGAADVRADIQNNAVVDHLRTPVGVGIRLDAIGVGAPDVRGSILAIVQDNILLRNRFGVMVHGAFPVADTELRGDVNLTLGNNIFEGSCQADLLVAFSRHQTGLGIDAKPRPFLLNSTFTLTLNGNLDWDDAWFAHPAGFGNALVVDGQTIPNGSRNFYDAAGCPGTPAS